MKFKKKTQNSGQSTIEFILSFAFILGILLTFIKISFNFTGGYLVHYATFMASRAYMVVDINSNDPVGSEARAMAVAQRAFNEDGLRAVGVRTDGLSFNAVNGSYNGNPVYVGTFTDFSTRFSLASFMGGQAPLDMRSESFLGREPTMATCHKRVCDALSIINSNCSFFTTLYDNGC